MVRANRPDFVIDGRLSPLYVIAGCLHESRRRRGRPIGGTAWWLAELDDMAHGTIRTLPAPLDADVG